MEVRLSGGDDRNLMERLLEKQIPLSNSCNGKGTCGNRCDGYGTLLIDGKRSGRPYALGLYDEGPR